MNLPVEEKMNQSVWLRNLFTKREIKRKDTYKRKKSRITNKLTKY